MSFSSFSFIFESIEDFLKSSHSKVWKNDLVVTSGGFDPLHVGHVRCIQASAKIAEQPNNLLVVIVNGDGFLSRKKGKPFMPLKERMEIIAAISGVDIVLPWDDGTQTVIGALEMLKPKIFTKGGDRSVAEAVPEFDICQKIGCKIEFGVGGLEKIQSSTSLLTTYSSSMPLYRPVGPKEMELIIQSGYSEFPARLPEQDFFYPVCNFEYARQISKWNIDKYGKSYILKFNVKLSFLNNYQTKIVGSKIHQEYWIPAADLQEMNKAIVGKIQVMEFLEK